MTELFFLPWRDLGRAERIALAVLATALLAWALMPPIGQDPAYHAFADRRALAGIANAADVLSNVAFLAVGLIGIARLASPRRAQLSPATTAGLWCVMLGFVGTAAGSAWYHLDPGDTSLFWDRLPMTLAFAGVLGAAVAQRIGQRLARAMLALLLEAGVASVVWWHLSGDLSLYAVLQFGGMAALVVLLVSTRGHDDPFPWWWLIGGYALAKVLESADQAIWLATGGVVAGHALKHLAAAAAGAALLAPIGAGSLCGPIAAGDREERPSHG